jgi:protein tyrosine phosphatase
MKLHHFLFHAWPDHGVPTTNEDIKALKQLLNTTSKLQKEEPAFRVRPRSALKPLPSWASGDEVAETVDTLREQRGMMCQTQSQIEFIYWMTGLKPARP